MRTLMTIVAMLAIAFISGNAAADSVVVTDTQGWQAVPITVDTQANTYTVTGTVPTDTSANYYYNYSGYRCFKVKREIAGVNAVVLNASVAGGSEIYCYPE